MTEENKSLAKRWLNDIWSEGNYALVHELHAPDYVRHDSPFPINNPDDYLRFIKAVREAFHDLAFTVEDVVAESDRVLLRWTASAVHKGEWAGVAATGKDVKVRGMASS